jgi:multiple sugar transport system permease protein
MMIKRKSLDKSHYGYLFIAPYFIAFFLFGIFPILYSFYLSFTKWNGSIAKPSFIKLANYERLIQDTVFFKSIGNTLIMWTVSIIPQMIFAIILAALLTNSKLKGKEAFRGIYYLPNLITMASVAVLFRFLMDWQSGALNRVLMSFHIIGSPVNWLQDVTSTRLTVSFISWWMWFGYSMIIFMAGIKAISEDVFEAATVDGASKGQCFWNITLPLLRPTMVYSIITSLIGGMTMFDVPFVLTNGDGAPQGGILTMVMYLYNTAFRNYNFGYGATIGTGLFLIILVAVILAYKLVNKNESYD